MKVEAPEDQGAEGPHQEARREGQQRGDVARRLVENGLAVGAQRVEEIRADDGGGRVEPVETVPLERGAEG